MSQFTTTDSLKFRSFLVAHGVDASSAEKVTAKVQRKVQRNKPLTAEEYALYDQFIIKANLSNGPGANVAQKVTPIGPKWQEMTLKRGYTSITSQKVSEMSFKFFRPKPSGSIPFDDQLTSLSNKATPLSNKAQRLSIKVQKGSAYSPGTVRQLAYKVLSS